MRLLRGGSERDWNFIAKTTWLGACLFLNQRSDQFCGDVFNGGLVSGIRPVNGLDIIQIRSKSDPKYPIRINFIRSTYSSTIQSVYPIINGLDTDYPSSPYIKQNITGNLG